MTSIANLGIDNVQIMFEFLEPLELARVQRTCKTLNRMVDHSVWKIQSLRRGILTINPEVEKAKNLTVENHLRFKFPRPLVSLIMDYIQGDLEVNYKENFTALRGELQLLRSTKCFSSKVTINVYSPESRAAYNAHHHEVFMEDGTWAETWRYIRPNPKLPLFPSYLPLSCFYDTRGIVRNDGDKIKLIFHGQTVILTCTHNRFDRIYYSNRRSSSFSESFADKMRFSLSLEAGVLRLPQATVDEAIATARNAPEWIDVTTQKRATLR